MKTVTKRRVFTMELKNNEIMITGGTSGIGLALAKELSKRGNKVVVLGRSKDRLSAVQSEYPEILTFQADVADRQSLIALQEWLPSHLPNLNIVINSAGVMKAHNMLDPELDLDALLSEIEINLVGTITVDKLFLPELMKQNEAMIVNISSGLAYLSSAPHPTYSASKAGVQMFTSALRDQLAYAGKRNVHVMELVPPLVSQTNLESGTPSGSFGDMPLDDLVTAAIKGMEQNKKRVNAGAAKVLRKMRNTASDKTEETMAKESLKQYFPEGL